MAATKITFSKGSPLKFKRSWSYSVNWLLGIALRNDIKVKELLIHWHPGSYSKGCPLGEADYESKRIMLCTHLYDKDTMLHELAHLGAIGVHGVNWSVLFIDLIKQSLSGEAREISLFLAKRDYRMISKVLEKT